MPEMPKFVKSSPQAVERFNTAMARLAATDITTKPMSAIDAPGSTVSW